MTAAPKKSTPKSFSDLTRNENKDNTVKHEHEPIEDSIGPDNDKPNVHMEDDNTGPYYADDVVALKADKTPAELAAESPAEAAKRYDINTTVSDEDANNPRVQVYRDTPVKQVPSGTHLHPDVAKDLQNRGISQQGTDNAQVRRQFTDGYDFAPDADHNDKFDAPAKEEEFDRDEDYVDDEHGPYGGINPDGNLNEDGTLKSNKVV